MQQGAMPAVTTKLHADGALGQAEMARGFELMMRAGSSNNRARVPRLQPADARGAAGGDRARRPTGPNLSRLAA